MKERRSGISLAWHFLISQRVPVLLGVAQLHWSLNLGFTTVVVALLKRGLSAWREKGEESMLLVEHCPSHPHLYLNSVGRRAHRLL